MEVGFKSDKGLQRSNNEDACFVLLPEKVYLVADGVGGGNSGEIASRTAVSEIANYIVNNPITKATNKYAVVNYLQDCLDKTNSKIYNTAVKYPENRGMATTVALVYAKEGRAYIANIGDSRVYLLRDDELVQLTEDHTYVHTLLKAGILTEEEAENDERKNVIIKALGADETVEPDFFQLNIMKDDIFLMCTDGLYDDVTTARMKEIIKSSPTMSDICLNLIEEANNNGGNDNITVIALKVTEEDVHEH